MQKCANICKNIQHYAKYIFDPYLVPPLLNYAKICKNMQDPWEPPTEQAVRNHRRQTATPGSTLTDSELAHDRIITRLSCSLFASACGLSLHAPGFLVRVFTKPAFFEFCFIGRATSGHPYHVFKMFALNLEHMCADCPCLSTFHRCWLDFGVSWMVKVSQNAPRMVSC